MTAIIVFWAGVGLCLAPFVSPPMALAGGLLFAALFAHPCKQSCGRWIKILLQFSVVGLGFGLNFGEVVRAGSTGVVFTAVSITLTLGGGLLLGRWLAVGKKTAFLVSAGTAICGGSAIAAVAPVVEADEHEIAVALGTVFLLNAAALFIFPPVGHLLGLSPHQFGLWSAIAIHDTSSVVGAAARYGDEALKIATTVKLTRTLWIIPLALGTAAVLHHRKAKIVFPYFIIGFVAASLVVSLVPALDAEYRGVVAAAKKGLTITLFLIGTGLSRDTLRTVGVRPVVQGVLLWGGVALASLYAVLHAA
ncbi:MAG: putative sulfate exporter family transporter [Lentisphaeria bacterium]